MGYQLKITIKDSHPPIWRRILVPDRITFFDLDDIIEKAFGWTHDHMFAFDFKDSGEEFLGTPIQEPTDTADECIDEWMEEGGSFTYTYDFGDNWIHTIKVEKVVPYGKRYPQVLKFKGPNMIEDCGGIWGFYEYQDEAEPFDLEAVNADFQKWNIPIVMNHSQRVKKNKFDSMDEFDDEELMHFLMESLDGNHPEYQEELEQLMQAMHDEEEAIRENVSEIKSLEDIFPSYTKDNLKQLAQIHGFTGYKKYNKKDMAQWLKNHLLDTQFMKNMILYSSEDEMELFEHAIEDHGICVTEEVIENHLLLLTYGGFYSDFDFYQIPQDVQTQYKKICTPEFQEECRKYQNFMTCCDAALYLYGVLPVEKFVEIYNGYEGERLDVWEAMDRIEMYRKRREPYALKEGFFMDEELAEGNLFRALIKTQEAYSYYIPKDREEFMAYGMYECQAENENTQFFLTYLQKKLHKKSPQDKMIFLHLEDGIRMNASTEELIDFLLACDCRISSQKQMEEVTKKLKKLGKYIRKWDYRGHTYAEVGGDRFLDSLN